PKIISFGNSAQPAYKPFFPIVVEKSQQATNYKQARRPVPLDNLGSRHNSYRRSHHRCRRDFFYFFVCQGDATGSPVGAVAPFSPLCCKGGISSSVNSNPATPRGVPQRRPARGQTSADSLILIPAN